MLHEIPTGSRCHQDKHQAPTLPHICMDYPHHTRESASTSYPLWGLPKPPAETACLQGTQPLLGTGLLEHESEELLKGEQLADQAFERHGFEGLILVEDMQTALRGIQM